MSILISNQKAYLEIIFQNKNKAYGAFELRKNYQHRAGKSLLIALFAISSFLLIQYYISNFLKVNGTKLIDLVDQNEDKIIIKEIIYKNIKTENPKPNLPKTNRKTPPSGNIVNRNKFVEQANTSTSSTRIEYTTSSSTTSTSPFNGATTAGNGEKDGGSTTETGGTTTTTTMTTEKETNFDEFAVDALPEFPGGEKALLEY